MFVFVCVCVCVCVCISVCLSVACISLHVWDDGVRFKVRACITKNEHGMLNDLNEGNVRTVMIIKIIHHK